jgi:7-cyano-7-deazaguanine reductase
MARTQPTSHLRAGKALPHATLGKKRTSTYTYDPGLLEAVPLALGRAFAGGIGERMWVSDNCLRFTSLCPVTGQPDWADLYLNYVPDRKLVESKSLKEYLHSFRMHGDFHEDVCRIIADDLVRCMAPRYLEVLGCFDSRGSIAIWPYVQYALPGDAAMERLKEHRFLNYEPGKYAPARYGRHI